MKWAVGLILVVGLATVGTAFVLLDGPSAALFSFATVVVMALGAAPVVFSAVTRKRERPRGPGPTVIRKDVELEAGPRPARAGRDRAHRRPRG